MDQTEYVHLNCVYQQLHTQNKLKNKKSRNFLIKYSLLNGVFVKGIKEVF